MKPDPNFVVDEKYLKPQKIDASVHKNRRYFPEISPPEPQKPEILTKKSFFNLSPKPQDKDQLLLWRTQNSLGFGVFTGFVNVWFNDFKKLPNLGFKQTLSFTANYFKSPFIGFSLFGISYATTDWILETLRGGNGKRSLQEYGLIGFNSVFFPVLLSSKSLFKATKYGTFAGFTFSMWKLSKFYQYEGIRNRVQENKAREYPVYQDPPPMPDFHKRRLYYNALGFEDARDLYSPEKLNDKSPDYKEE